MDKELEDIFKETLYLDDNCKIDDDMFIGSIVEWDSLSHMNLIYNISSKYGIKISFKDLKNIHNWGELKECVKNKIER